MTAFSYYASWSLDNVLTEISSGTRTRRDQKGCLSQTSVKLVLQAGRTNGAHLEYRRRQAEGNVKGLREKGYNVEVA
jgi:hypothetical protein